jgi:hypothetical protein
MVDMTETDDTIFFLRYSRKLEVGLFALLMLLGVGVRLLDLTDLPFDFAITRQMHSMIISRGLYYQMDSPATLSMPQDLRTFGINAGHGEAIIEPPIMETLTAYTYRLAGGENLVFPRLYSILFWVLGAGAVYLLAKMFTTRSGAFVATAVYLFTPFGVIASRSFQPDPLMISLVCWALYFQFRWDQHDTWINALMAGLFTGLAVLVKAIAAFYVGLPILALVLNKGFRNWARNPRVWVMAFLSLAPGVIYNLISVTVGGNASAIFGTRFFPNLFTQVEFYAGWATLIRGAVGFGAFLMAMTALLLIRNRSQRVFFGAMWLGYILFGMTVAYHISTHNYYQLPVFPIVSLGVGIFMGELLRRLETNPPAWSVKALIWILFFFLIAVNINEVRGTLYAENYRPEKTFWSQLGEKLGHNSAVIALTQDYGGRLSYFGFINPRIWSTTGDFRLSALSGSTDPDVIQLIQEKTAGMDYFLVTALGDFDAQPVLKEYLFTHYAVDTGDGYYIFELHKPLIPGS